VDEDVQLEVPQVGDDIDVMSFDLIHHRLIDFERGLALLKACLKRTLLALRRFVLLVSSEGYDCNLDY